MRKLLAACIAIIAGFLLFIPAMKQNENRTEMNPSAEMRMKQSLMQADADRTHMLNRTRMTSVLQRTLRKISNGDKEKNASILRQLLHTHPHVSKVIWLTEDASVEHPVETGRADNAWMKNSGNYLRLAKNRLKEGQTYHSPLFQSGGKQYYIVGVPGEKKQGLIAVVEDSAPEKVRDHQQKNLRIVPYPQKKPLMKSVDSDSLSGKKVRSPEDNEDTSHYYENEVVVKFAKAPDEHQLQRICREIQCVESRKMDHTYIFKSGQMTTKQLLSHFKNKKEIEFAEPHYIYVTNEEQVELIPNDELFSDYQWNLPIIHTLEGWKVSRGSEDVIVAVIDTGVDLQHSDLQGHLTEGYNVVNDTGSPADDVGHGTHVAGVIAALVNNQEGIAGMSWHNKIMPVKVLDNTGAGSTYDVARGIIWAVDHGAKVINLSLGNYAEAEFLHDAIRYAYERDVVLVAATGNDNTSDPGYPAAYPEVLAVSATDAAQERAFFSNYGEYIDIVAPGVNIASTYPGNQYAALSGTSMASPHVAALAAMIRSVNPQLSSQEVMDIIRKTASDMGPQGKDDYFGYGQINVQKALEYAISGENAVRIESSAGWQHWLAEKLESIRNFFGG